VAENGPEAFPRHSNLSACRFDLFLEPPPQAVSHFCDIPFPTSSSPSLLKGPILAPRPLCPKWTSLDLPLRVMARCICGRRPPGDLRPRLPSRRPPELGRLLSFMPKCGLKSWRRHWIVPVTREETLAIRDKIWKIS